MSSVRIKAVLDTNIIVSALFWRGAPHQVLKEGLEGTYAILISPAILEEAFYTLTEKFSFPIHDARAFLETIAARGIVVIPTKKIRAIKSDSSDNKIIECAIAGEATHIVTGDKHILSLGTYHTIHILTPAQFLKHAL